MVLNIAGMDDKDQLGNKKLSQLCCESENFLINNLRTYKTWLQVHMPCEHSVNDQLDGNFVFPMRILMIFLGQ